MVEETKEQEKEVVEEQKEVPKESKPVTQEAIDRIYKEMRETQERLDRAEKKNVELVGRLAQSPAPTTHTDDSDKSLNEKYNERNFPKTESDWDDLIAEFPTYGVDLRAIYLAGNQKQMETQTKSRDTVEKKHPDMFEKNADGSLRRDANGLTILDTSTEKGKVFNSILSEDPQIMSLIKGPEFAMAAMEARMSGQKEAKVAEELTKEKQEAEAKRKEGVAAGAVVSGGEAPPKEKAVEVKFNSDEEKEHAESLVASGKVKSLSDYCAVRDNNIVDYGRGGF